MIDLIQIVGTLRRRGVGFKSLHEALDTTTPGGRLVFHVFAALAEFIRQLIVEGTREGLVAARDRGVRLGRPPAMTAEQIQHARDLLTRPDNAVSSIARLLGVSCATIYKPVPEVATGRVSRRPASRTGVAGKQLHVLSSHYAVPDYRAGQVLSSARGACFRYCPFSRFGGRDCSPLELIAASGRAS